MVGVGQDGGFVFYRAGVSQDLGFLLGLEMLLFAGASLSEVVNYSLTR